jgi:RNA polymerase sigma factor (sigma-70 family)
VNHPATPEYFYAIANRVWNTYGRWRKWRAQDREDAIQCAVIRCWQYRDRFDTNHRVPPHAYFGMVARHEITQYLRRRKYRPLTTSSQQYEGHHPFSEPDEVLNASILDEELAELRRALGTLPPETAAALLRHAGGDTLQSIGTTLGCSRQAVKMRCDLAMKKLAKRMTVG